MTTVYSFSQIEEYLRSLGPLYLRGLISRPNNPNIPKFEAAQSAKEALLWWTKANWGGYGLPERINVKGEAEKGFLRSTITDLYRAVLYKFPEADLESVYHSLYELIEEREFYSCVCSDIHKRVYGLDTNKMVYLNSLPNATLDEYGVDHSKFITPNIRIDWSNSTNGVAHLIKIPNAKPCLEPAL